MGVQVVQAKPETSCPGFSRDSVLGLRISTQFCRERLITIQGMFGQFRDYADYVGVAQRGQGLRARKAHLQAQCPFPSIFSSI